MDALRPGQVLRLPTGDETIVDVAVEKLLP
jgi:hypothetical protein